MTTQRISQVLGRCAWAAFGLIVAGFFAVSLAWIYVRHGEDAFHEALGQLVLDELKREL